MPHRIIVEGEKDIHIMMPKYSNYEKSYGCQYSCCNNNNLSNSTYEIVPETIEIPVRKSINLEDFFKKNKDYKLFYNTENETIDLSMFSVNNVLLKNYLTEHFFDYKFNITKILIEKYDDVISSDIEKIYMNINPIENCRSISDIHKRSELLSKIEKKKEKKKEYMYMLKCEYNREVNRNTLKQQCIYGTKCNKFNKNESLMSFDDWAKLCKGKNRDERKKLLPCVRIHE